MSGATPMREWGIESDEKRCAMAGGRFGRWRWPSFVTKMSDPSGITKFEGGTGADMKMWGKARANSGCSKMLGHPEFDIADGGFTNMERRGVCAAGAL